MMNISLLLLVATIAVTAASASHRSCAPIHILAARGTGEAPGVGVISSLSDLVVRAHPGTTQEPIHYPAAVDPVSVKEGIDSVADQLGDYVRKCPDSQVVLVGISQGIRVILDALCGSGYPDLGGTGKPRVRQSVGSHVKAVVGYGDPGNTANEPFVRGTATKSGIYPRPAGACEAYSNIIASYCDEGDPICASGDQAVVHMSYPFRYNAQAARFIYTRLSSHA